MTNYHTSGMTLISPNDCIWSQSTRMVILEKQIPIELKFYDANNPPDYLLELNPNALSPTLIDKKLILYHVTIIMEYLEERFPQPALNKMDPISKANNRMIIKRVSDDWCQLLENILYHCEKPEPSKKMLTESLLSAIPLFRAKKYFLSDTFTLIDCLLAPLLWRLPKLGIPVFDQSADIKNYAQRLFSRPSFKGSLSPKELKLGDFTL
ncbi:MAG TPA: stringent starvation protein A [Methylococcaceae bacterium]|nr:stringent starvation protein A [Methylococcaceae bacterium]